MKYDWGVIVHCSLSSASGSPAEHPFRPLLRVRASAPEASGKAPEAVRPPLTYKEHALLRAPAEGLSSEYFD